MARFSWATFGLLLVLSVVAAAPVDESGFLVEMSGTSKISKVKTANYYGYGQTELSCLSQLNFKSCRYTGCPECLYNDCRGTEIDTSCTDSSDFEEQDFGLTNIFFQTDFTCCPKDHSYGYEDRHDVGSLGFSDKVGTCDWEISIYRWPNLEGTEGPGTGGTTDVTPVLTDDGNAVKFGTAWGTCYLNAEAEHCDHPLCERMAINIQGGLYVARAYGDTAVETVPVYEETCNGGDANLPEWTVPDLGDLIPDVGSGRTSGGQAAARRGEGGVRLFPGWVDFILNAGLQILKVGSLVDDCTTQTTIGTTTVTESTTTGPLTTTPSKRRECRRATLREKRAQKKARGQARTASGDDTNVLYPGAALIISGPFHVTSKHTGKIAETGLFEFAPIFYPDEAGSPVSEPTEKWPVVRGKGAKLRFTKEEKGDNYYKNDYYKDEQKIDRRDDKEYYEKREYYRE